MRKEGGSNVVSFDRSLFKLFTLRNAYKYGCPVTGMKQFYSNMALKKCWQHVKKMFADFFFVGTPIPICHG
jgi:hypothetical protein